MALINNMNKIDFQSQKDLCKRYNTEYCPTPDGWKVGVSKNINTGIMPLNGLRHMPENGTMGWYIWAGEYSEREDFFEPIHVEHLMDICPSIIKYLGLPPGWRFQVDNSGYEDVWKDEGLLKG